MTDQFESALKRLVTELRAEAALVWSLIGRSGAEEDGLERLRAVLDRLPDGVVTVDQELAEATVNKAAAELLELSHGGQSQSNFRDALKRLSRRSMNHDEFDSQMAILDSDPTASIECMLRFAGRPSHILVASRPDQGRHFQGRTWVFYDESESSQAIELLTRAHAQLRASADAMLDPQVLLEAIRDPAGQTVDLIYRDVNHATCGYLGVSRKDLIGSSLLESVPNLAGSGLMARYAHCAETGEPVVLDAFPSYLDVMESPRHFDIRAAAAGPDLISLTWRDVTERVEAAERIGSSEQRFRLLAENVGDVVMHIRGGVIAWVSPSVEEVLGAGPEHWVGRKISDIIAPEDRDAHEKVTWLDQDRTVVPRGRVVAADGSTHWVHVHAKAFYDAGGNPDGYTASFRVIDDEMHAIEKVEEAQRQKADADARYRRLMDNSAVGMCMVTPQGRFETVNEALCDFFGYDAETLATMTWQQLTTGETLAADLRSADDLLAGRTDRYRVTKQYVHADGHLIWGDLSVSCLRDARGKVEYFVSQVIDITAEVESQRQIAQRDQQNRALAQRLQAQTDRLRSELKVAGAYVTELLPGKLDGPVQVSHLYMPSRELGGDCLDYRWIDDEHLLIYLIDVSGHGLAPALEAISVHNLLRSGSLPTATLLEPAEVLAELNAKFPMEEHGGNYFTMWYGVYRAPTRTLRYASAGHPPALVFTDSATESVRLAGEGLPVGMFVDAGYSCETYVVPPNAEVVLYSDGAFEFPTPDGTLLSLDDFVALCSEVVGTSNRTPDGTSHWTLHELAGKLQGRTSTGLFSDDCSLLRLHFS